VKRQQRSNRFSIYTLFFDAIGQQKRWFVVSSVLLPLILTIIFSIWGTVISIKSYNLSVETSNNREQLDTMKVMIDNLREQSKLLIDQNKMIFTQVNQLSRIINLNENSNDIQTRHYSTIRENINESKVPKLSVEKVEYELKSTNEADFGEFYYVKMVNYGGDIYRLRHKELDSIGSGTFYLPVNSMPKNSDMEITFLNPFLNTHKTTLRLRFSYEDILHVQYYQDLNLFEEKDGVQFQLGKMIPVTK
jgi:hypothetical protein